MIGGVLVRCKSRGVYILDKFDKFFMDIAHETAKLSYCKRKQVGAVLVRDKRIIANGFNGTIPNTPNVCECENEHGELVTNEFTVHAEQNVLTFCAREGLSTKDSTLYVTLSPCKTCAKLLASSGITRVVYGEEYKDTSGVDFLKTVGLNVERYICEEK